MQNPKKQSDTKQQKTRFTFIDLFAGIGGFRLAMESLGGKCVYSCEIDQHACSMYEANFGENPYGDIRQIHLEALPDFDILCAGFPCQPFSAAGKKEGFLDETRGTLFFDIARILKEKKPKVFLLENVKNLYYHDKGKTLKTILKTLNNLSYTVSYQILNARDFGLPQNRERIFLIGNREGKVFDFSKLHKTTCHSMEFFLDDFYFGEKENLPVFHYLSEGDYTILPQNLIKTNQNSGLRFCGYLNKNIRKRGIRPGTLHLSRVHKQPNRIYSIKGIHPTLSAGETSGRYFIYDGEKVRRLTLNECYRFFGFPESFIRTGSKTQQYKRIGNSVCVPVVREIGREVLEQFL